MKRAPSQQAFTLIEMLTVIVIILVIAGWVVSAYGPGNVKAARTRALAEIRSLSAGCESYKADNGSYPRSEGVTEPKDAGNAPLDPKKNGNPQSDAYKRTSAFLYKALSGDYNQDGMLRGADEPSKGYMDFPPNLLGGTKNAKGVITKVEYIQDPFGNSYGYSTAGARAEELFEEEVKTKGSEAKRTEDVAGYNSTFDLWSTGGRISTNAPGDSDRVRWVKNW